MVGTDDDDESDEALKAELTGARDNLRRQLDILAAGPVGRYVRKSDFDQQYADLTEELQQVETELGRYGDLPVPTEDGDQQQVDGRIRIGT